ncbi:DUF4189 domain-containing protein [Stenotrophomonas bentonitica]
MRLMIVLLSLAFLPFTAFAEGRCPPGQYPIGGQGAGGCAPIPSSGGADSRGPVPTGKWETRWGAISEDPTTLATGASVSMKSKRQAIAAATAECERLGGKACKTRLTYYNQCAAIADATAESLKGGAGTSIAAHAETEDQAKSLALAQCSSAQSGQKCSIVYAACSMSEFKSFR